MEVRERPIIFSGPMIRAILEGRKTVTRRVIKGPTPIAVGTGWSRWWSEKMQTQLSASGFAKCHCPYGAPGDRLWVRETWADCSTNPLICEDTIAYRATEPEWDRDCTGIRWRPSIHMPRWASRITLEITNVRVERVQDITEEDAEAEGVLPIPSHLTSVDYVTPFADLWNRINAKRGYSWAANPWVWVVEFRRVEK